MINPIISTGSAVDHCQDGEDSHLKYVTLRDLFAAVVIHGFYASSNNCNYQATAEAAYLQADAMLAERAKAKP